MKILGMLFLILSMGFGIGTYCQSIVQAKPVANQNLINSQTELKYHVIEDYGMRDFKIKSNILSELQFPEHWVQLTQTTNTIFVGHYDSTKEDEDTFDITIELTNDLSCARITLDIYRRDDLVILHATKI